MPIVLNSFTELAALQILTWDELLDPRKNKYFKLNIKLGEYLKWTDQLYSPVNYGPANNGHLFPGMDAELIGILQHAEFQRYRKYFAFLRAYSDCVEGIYCRNTTFGMMSESYWVYGDGVDATQKRAGLKNFFEIAEASHTADTLNSPLRGMACPDGSFLEAHNGFIRETGLFFYDDQYLNPSALLNHRDISQLVIKYSSYRHGMLSVLLEGQPENRNHLYKHFGYSVGVDSCLPGVTRFATDKRSRKRKDKEVKLRPHSPTAPLYGIELECTSQHKVKDIIDAQEEPFFICKQDSSISGACDNRYEFVTKPMDYRSHRIAWGKFFAKFLEKDGSYKGFDVTKDTTNGMHVHISRASFSEDHWQRFVWFVYDPCNYPFILAISERGEAMGQYAQIPDLSRKTRRQAFDKCDTMTLGGSRGALCGKTKTGVTYEVRIFKGIVSYACLLKNLEFVDSLYYFTQQSSYHSTTVHNYIKWLEEQPKNKYKMIRKFIDGIGVSVLKQIRYNIIFASCNDLDDIQKVMKSRRIKPSVEIVTMINRKFKKKGKTAPFVLSKGKIIKNPLLYTKLVSDEVESLKHFAA